jgi:L-lactate dehydrogenase complex protein LldE
MVLAISPGPSLRQVANPDLIRPSTREFPAAACLRISGSIRKMSCCYSRIAFAGRVAVPARKVPASKRVQFMATCLCDAFFDDVAVASVEVLEHLGCTVTFPEGQTCCGQPAFNGGDWENSRKVVRHTVRVFAGDDPVIIPSGSCAAMMFHGALLEFEKEADLPAVQSLASRCWEFSDFIVNGLGIKQWPGRFPAKVAFHRSCHTRGTPSGETARQLLSSIEGLELQPFGQADQCCGFGGTFSVTFPTVSAAMGELKLEHAMASNPDVLASGDMGCLMHLGGLSSREGSTQPRILHIAQILRDSLRSAGLLAQSR